MADKPQKASSIINIMIKRHLGMAAGLLFLLSAPGCSQQAESIATKKPAQFDYNATLGWLQGPCLAIRNDRLKAGSRLVLIIFKNRPVLGAAVVKSRTQDNCPALNQGRAGINLRRDLTYYAIDDGSMAANSLAVGVLTGRSLQISQGVSATSVRLDINGDGHLELVNMCTTSEGIKFFAWPGAAYTGRPLWEDYYYLGYDLKATCPAGRKK